jgi:hypothetical protein
MREGNKSSRWKGGRICRARGYISVLRPDHPNANAAGYVYEHRLVMEAQIGRLLLPNEQVHHIDHDKSNNEPSNLKIVTSREHLEYHPLKRNTSGLDRYYAEHPEVKRGDNLKRWHAEHPEVGRADNLTRYYAEHPEIKRGDALRRYRADKARVSSG